MVGNTLSMTATSERTHSTAAEDDLRAVIADWADRHGIADDDPDFSELVAQAAIAASATFPTDTDDEFEHRHNPGFCAKCSGACHYPPN